MPIYIPFPKSRIFHEKHDKVTKMMRRRMIQKKLWPQAETLIYVNTFPQTFFLKYYNFNGIKLPTEPVK
jgi:hypothetical protein